MWIYLFYFGVLFVLNVWKKIFSLFWRDLSVELPFTLTHPKPEPEPETIIKESEAKKTTVNTSAPAIKETPPVTNGNDQTVPVDLNLIEFDTK